MSIKFTLNKANNSAEILIYELIGEGWFGGMSAKRFVDELDQLGPLSTLDIRIESDGGSVFDGYAIYNAIMRKRNQGTIVNVHIDGLAASIASVIAMAGENIYMSENAWIMIHNPYTIADGGAEELRRAADLLEGIRDQIIAVYDNRSGQGVDKIGAWLNQETWFNAVDAKKYGFVDSITEPLEMAAAHNLAKFDHPPAQLIAATNQAIIATTPAPAPASAPEASPAHNRMTARLAERNL